MYYSSTKTIHHSVYYYLGIAVISIVAIALVVGQPSTSAQVVTEESVHLVNNSTVVERVYKPVLKEHWDKDPLLLFDITDDPNYNFAWEMALALDVPYDQLVFIQEHAGIQELLSILYQLDPSDTQVHTLTEKLEQHINLVRTAKPFSTLFEGTAEEQAEEYIHTLANEFRFYSYSDDYVEQRVRQMQPQSGLIQSSVYVLRENSPRDVTRQMEQLSGLRARDLLMIQENGLLEETLQMLPDELAYKPALLQELKRMQP